MAKQKLPVGGYMDSLIWVKVENAVGELTKYVFYPITRYRNIMNRPRVISESDNVAATPNGEFHLVTTDIEDVDEQVLFELYRQTW